MWGLCTLSVHLELEYLAIPTRNRGVRESDRISISHRPTGSARECQLCARRLYKGAAKVEAALDVARPLLAWRQGVCKCSWGRHIHHDHSCQLFRVLARPGVRQGRASTTSGSPLLVMTSHQPGLSPTEPGLPPSSAPSSSRCLCLRYPRGMCLSTIQVRQWAALDSGCLSASQPAILCVIPDIIL